MITVTPADLTHVEIIAEIAEEMDRFYGATKVDPAPVRISQISEALFSDPPSAYAQDQVAAKRGGTRPDDHGHARHTPGPKPRHRCRRPTRRPPPAPVESTAAQVRTDREN